LILYYLDWHILNESKLESGEVKINICWVFYATPEMRIHYQRFFGAP